MLTIVAKGTYCIIMLVVTLIKVILFVQYGYGLIKVLYHITVAIIKIL